jgi:hypothetical protein
MKRYVELGLAALLAVLIYEKPQFLLNATHSTLGKFILIIIVGLLAKQFGLNAGLLGAIIMIVLLETNREGIGTSEDSANSDGEDGGKCDCNKNTKDNIHNKCDSCKSCKEKKNIKEGYDNINRPLHPAPVLSGTDQITLDRQFKVNAEYAKNAASQQINGCTN